VIYLDNSATTPLAPEVREAMLPYLGDEYGNASSVYSLGTRARVALEEARATIAKAIGADAREIIFTSSGTEANNAAIKGTILEKHFTGIPFKNIHAITSPAEHHAVLNPFHFIEKLGSQAEQVQVDSAGVIYPQALTNVLRKDLTLASFMMVNNEVGAISPIKDLTSAVKSQAKDALVHCDAVQALGKIKIDVRDLGVDMLSLSAHKIHGPKGIGVLYARSGIKWEPLMHGGAQERNRRGGTESVALAIGFAKAVELGEATLEETQTHLIELRDYLLSRLAEHAEVVLNTDPSRSVPSIVNFSFTPEVLAHLDGEALLIRFDLEGIAISNGSACTSGSLQPSHVLIAMGKGHEVASKSIRVSFSRYTDKSAIDRFIAALETIIPRSAKVSAA
jgi:cysteine desulfurase